MWCGCERSSGTTHFLISVCPAELWNGMIGVGVKRVGILAYVLGVQYKIKPRKSCQRESCKHDKCDKCTLQIFTFQSFHITKIPCVGCTGDHPNVTKLTCVRPRPKPTSDLPKRQFSPIQQTETGIRRSYQIRQNEVSLNPDVLLLYSYRASSLPTAP
jgi:hypothetical protein